MNFLQQNCRFGFYTQGKAALCKSFKCGDNDLDDFFTAGTTTWMISSQKTHFCRAKSYFAKIIVFPLSMTRLNWWRFLHFPMTASRKFPDHARRKSRRTSPAKRYTAVIRQS